MVQPAMPQVILVRHGQTEWSKSGQHTGRSDIPLTEIGEDNARRVGPRLKSYGFAHVLCSPLQRAKKTCELAGHLDGAEIVDDLMEWDYGSFDGRKTVDIRAEQPNWLVFRDGCPEGENAEQVGERADRVIEHIRGLEGDVAIFSHGHYLRVFAARWLGIPARNGRFFKLNTGAVCLLSYDHGSLDEPVILHWNDDSHLDD